MAGAIKKKAAQELKLSTRTYVAGVMRKVKGSRIIDR